VTEEIVKKVIEFIETSIKSPIPLIFRYSVRFPVEQIRLKPQVTEHFREGAF